MRHRYSRLSRMLSMFLILVIENRAGPSKREVRFVTAAAAAGFYDNSGEYKFDDDKGTGQSTQKKPFKNEVSYDEGSISSLFAPLVFRTTRPRGIIEGMSHAIGNVFKGAVGGSAAFLIIPIFGAVTHGVGGFAIGAIVGALSGIFLPLTGAVLAIHQALLGVQTIPSLFTKEVYCRGEYYLEKEAQDIGSSKKPRDRNESGRSKRQGSSRQVKDTLFYDLLHVPVDATQSEIKRGYYRTARNVHPDKNSDDDAEEAFRKVSVAYQILSDEGKRAAYDQNGPRFRQEDGEFDGKVEGEGLMIDPVVFFAIMFGSHLVEPYIGELRIASDVDYLMQFANGKKIVLDLKSDFSTECSTVQRRRVLGIAIKLRERVAAYVSGFVTQEDFIMACRKEAEAVAKVSFGGTFLKAIGSSMILESEEFLGYNGPLLGKWKGFLLSCRKKLELSRINFLVYGAMIQTGTEVLTAFVTKVEPGAGAEENNQRRARPPGLDDEQFKAKLRAAEVGEKLSESLPTVLELIWAFNIRDITYTLRDACHKLFSDLGVSMGERLKRAQAVHYLGREFYTLGVQREGQRMVPRFEMEDVMARVDVAFATSVMKARGQDITNDTEREISRKKRNARASKRPA